MHIIICGPAACGKEYLKEKFEKQGMTAEISYTSREIRDGEIVDKTYHYITREKFEEMKDAGFFLQWDDLGGNYYGTSINEWNTKQIFIMSPKGIAKLSPEDRKKSFVIYLDIPERTRLDRLTERGWDREKVRHRIQADYEQFVGFLDYDLKVKNPDF